MAGASSVSARPWAPAFSPKYTDTNGISRPPDRAACSMMYAFVSSTIASLCHAKFTMMERSTPASSIDASTSSAVAIFAAASP